MSRLVSLKYGAAPLTGAYRRRRSAAASQRSSSRSTTLALGEMVSQLFLEKCRRGFEPAQMAGLHEHDGSLDADAGPRDSLQPPALGMRGEKSRGDKPEADPARHERHLHVDIV